MKRNLHITLFIVMIVFALCTSLSLSTYYYIQTKQLKQEHENSILDEHISQLIFALDTNEKAVHHFGNNVVDQMKTTTMILSGLYNNTQNFSEWDFAALSKQFKTDIYIINENNVIEYSNLAHEVGLDFSKCCKTLSSILDERREIGSFYHDGLEVEQATGELKKYSYMSTEDNKYLIQLGIYWKNTTFYSAFQFDNVADQLINERLTSIRILNFTGNPLGTKHADYDLSDENMKAFNEAVKKDETVILDSLSEQNSISYIYIPFTSEHDESYTSEKVIEIIYNRETINNELNTLARYFVFQILFILFITTLLSLYISYKFSKPIFLAFHDPLTRIGNRAYLNEYVSRLIVKEKLFTLIMFDIDNFKLINDRFGHATGDEIIKKAANILAEHSNSNGYSFRIGGDEFVVILSKNDRASVEQTVKIIVEQFNTVASSYNQNDVNSVTLSIGIAYAKEHGCNLDDIMKCADTALYKAKHAGKNQWVTCEKEVSSV